MKHTRREHREPSSEPAAEERVGRKGRVCVNAIAINNIVRRLQEDNKDTCSDEGSRDDLWDPYYIGVAGPRENVRRAQSHVSTGGITNQANQNMPIGRQRPANIITGRRSSGTTLPASSTFRLKRVLVAYKVIAPPNTTPTRIARNGNAPTPAFQPRSSWKAIG